MIARAVGFLLLVAAALPAGAAEMLTFQYIYIEDDPFYAPGRAYTGLELRARHRPREGVETGLKESRVPGRAAGIAFDLADVPAAGPEDAAARVAAAAAHGADVFLLDLPADGVRAVAAATAGSGREVILLSMRAPDDDLRTMCDPALLNVAPSRSMLADALAQYLYRMGWERVLMLVGERPEDEVTAAAFHAAAEKFGLTIVAERPFALSNDPRQRDRTSIALMTGEPAYDVVYLADSVGEFGRFVPYSTVLPRPVVGSEGLTAEAWNWTWERHGAPQLNQRFERIAGRHMTSDDWTGWAAVKSVVEAAVRLRTTSGAAIRDYLRGDTFALDTYKGTPGTFRPWSGQLRQPILLSTHDAVIELAPLDGFLHERNNLDTLGSDAEPTACR
jgi:ABC transporter substrate binding protein (PQQ-dependent alcohol dehydrogenase system)